MITAYGLWIRIFHGGVNRIHLFNPSEVWTWNYCWRWKIHINFHRNNNFKKSNAEDKLYKHTCLFMSCTCLFCTGVEDKSWSEGEMMQGFFWINKKGFDNKWFNKITPLIRQIKKSNISRSETWCSMNGWGTLSLCTTRWNLYGFSNGTLCRADPVWAEKLSLSVLGDIPLFHYKKTALFLRDYNGHSLLHL